VLTPADPARASSGCFVPSTAARSRGLQTIRFAAASGCRNYRSRREANIDPGATTGGRSLASGFSTLISA